MLVREAVFFAVFMRNMAGHSGVKVYRASAIIRIRKGIVLTG